MGLSPREIAIKLLININENNAYSNIELNQYMNKDMDQRDENLIRELVYGVLENKLYIDYIVSKASKVKLKKIHPNILEILRIGIYQICFMDKIPERAAVNESVNLAKKYGHKGTIGYVNGVLRSISRDKEKYMNIDNMDNINYISIKYSHPKYLVRRWMEEFGLEFTEELCKENNKRPFLNIRVNTLKINKNDLQDVLLKQGIATREGKYADDCLIVDNPNGITALDEFKKGLFTIQDESSMLVSQIMNPKDGSKAIDVCSAPGGKATHMAQIMNNNGLIISRDVHNHKIELIEDNAKRLGINIIKTQLYDALVKDENLISKFDYCLLDAPCSGLGLIRRKPEIKWNRKEEDIKALAILQLKIIENAKDYVKPGGVLVYSTCTIEKEENINLVETFLNKNPDFKLVNIQDRLKNKDGLNTLNQGYIQLYPHIHGTDGFFIAKMIRRG